MTVAEAYQAFLAILETNGLTVVPHGRFLKIIDSAGSAAQDTPIFTAGQAAPSEDRYITRIHRLSHVSADEMSQVLGHFKTKDGDITVFGNLLIITDTGTNIRRMMELVEQIDVGGAGDQVWIEPIHYASASDIKSRIEDIFPGKGAPVAEGARGAGHSGGQHHPFWWERAPHQGHRRRSIELARHRGQRAGLPEHSRAHQTARRAAVG